MSLFLRCAVSPGPFISGGFISICISPDITRPIPILSRPPAVNPIKPNDVEPTKPEPPTDPSAANDPPPVKNAAAINTIPNRIPRPLPAPAIIGTRVNSLLSILLV